MLETLPARWYADPEVHAHEQERIFRRAWQYAGRSDQVAEAGDFFTAMAGPVPVVVVRDADGELRAHVNVCRHRGHLVASGAGRCSTLQCPYHAWTYGLDGALRKAPRADREGGVPLGELGLLPASVGTWGPFVFVHADADAEPLTSVLGDLPEVLASSGAVLEELEWERRTEWSLEANWKIAVENYLECYHCQVAHPGLSKLVDVRPDAYGLHERDTFSFQTGPLRERGFGEGPVDAAQWHWLWPNHAINVEPSVNNVSIDIWLPDGPNRTRGVTDYFFAPDVPREVRDELMAFSAEVGDEDIGLVENVHRGLASGALDAGRLMPESERLVAHFQRLVGAALA